MITRRLCLSVAALLAFTSAARASIIAGPITSPINGHKYYLTSSETWPQSEAEGIALGGHLVTIRNAAENNWILNTFLPLDSDYSVHIGLNDIAQEGVYQWSSGEPVNYLHWGQGEPNNLGNEDWCEEMLRSFNVLHPGDWNDGSISTKGVLEVVPEPCTATFLLCGVALALRRRAR